jgi:hypothetical protein
VFAFLFKLAGIIEHKLGWYKRIFTVYNISIAITNRMEQLLEAKSSLIGE